MSPKDDPLNMNNYVDVNLGRGYHTLLDTEDLDNVGCL